MSPSNDHCFSKRKPIYWKECANSKANGFIVKLQRMSIQFRKPVKVGWPEKFPLWMSAAFVQAEFPSSLSMLLTGPLLFLLSLCRCPTQQIHHSEDGKWEDATERRSTQSWIKTQQQLKLAKDGATTHELWSAAATGAPCGDLLLFRCLLEACYIVVLKDQWDIWILSTLGVMYIVIL